MNHILMTPATTTSNAVPSNKQKPERKMEAFLPCAVSSACCARLLQGQWNVDKMHQSLTFLRGNTFFLQLAAPFFALH